MEDNKLIPVCDSGVSFDDRLSGVQIERSKRRYRKKNYRKRFLIFCLFVCAIALVIYNFNSISNFFKSLFDFDESSIIPPESEQDGDSTENSTNNNSSNEKNNPTEGIDNPTDLYPFIDTSPSNFTTIFEFNNSFDLEKLDYCFEKKDDLYSRYGSDAPIVLIVSFSPFECYSEGNGYTYSSEFNSENQNVSDVGKEICNNLNSLGINAKYLECVSESDSMYESKMNYEKEIKNFLANTPSISYVFDISRSIKFNRDMSINREMIAVGEEMLPTINFICGTKSGTASQSQEKGIKLSDELSKYFNSSYPLFVSRQTVSRFDLNLQFPVPSIRVDIGSYANTYAEALCSAKLFSSLLASFLS